ncbi:MAG TPA: hypothetical protein VNJ54_14350 [Plantibacter sp.]|uniref:hypothetical protein n=1 Tax=unclassified Plantibacter TaxID=2624265 RepID=UPI002BDF331E|nr:hypothetical protein [Plantibacter sp.]
MTMTEPDAPANAGDARPYPDRAGSDAPLPQEVAWELLREALVQDFIDDLPKPVRTAELAARLHVSRASLMTNIRRGNVTATRQAGRWEIDTVASRTYLRSAILSLGDRRRSLSGVDEDRSANVQLTLSGRASEVLSDLMNDTHLSAPELVAIALDRFRTATGESPADEA